MKIRIGLCKNCNQVGVLGGRDLDGSCYSFHHKHGTLDRFPRATWKNSELLAELDICRARGLTVREAAEKIGVKLSTLRRAIDRARTRELAAVGDRS